MSGHVNVLADASTPGFILTTYTTTGPTFVGRLAAVTATSTSLYTIGTGSTIVTPSTAGTLTYSLYISSTSGTVSVKTGLGLATWFMVEDIGPASTVP